MGESLEERAFLVLELSLATRDGDGQDALYDLLVHPQSAPGLQMLVAWTAFGTTARSGDVTILEVVKSLHRLRALGGVGSRSLTSTMPGVTVRSAVVVQDDGHAASAPSAPTPAPIPEDAVVLLPEHVAAHVQDGVDVTEGRSPVEAAEEVSSRTSSSAVVASFVTALDQAVQTAEEEAVSRGVYSIREAMISTGGSERLQPVVSRVFNSPSDPGNADSDDGGMVEPWMTWAGLGVGFVVIVLASRGWARHKRRKQAAREKAFRSTVSMRDVRAGCESMQSVGGSTRQLVLGGGSSRQLVGGRSNRQLVGGGSSRHLGGGGGSKRQLSIGGASRYTRGGTGTGGGDGTSPTSTRSKRNLLQGQASMGHSFRHNQVNPLQVVQQQPKHIHALPAPVRRGQSLDAVLAAAEEDEAGRERAHSRGVIRPGFAARRAELMRRAAGQR